MGFNIRKSSEEFNLWKYPKLAVSSKTDYKKVSDRLEREEEQREKLRILREDRKKQLEADKKEELKKRIRTPEEKQKAKEYFKKYSQIPEVKKRIKEYH